MEKIKLPETLTADWLGDSYACQYGLAYFRRTWGDEVRLDRSALDRIASDNPAHLYWLLSVLGDAHGVGLHAASSKLARDLTTVRHSALGLNAKLREALISGVDEDSDTYEVLTCGASCDLRYALCFLPHREVLRSVALECFEIPD